MNFLKKLSRTKRSGVVLIVSMIFVLVFSALAVAMATLSGQNVQLASNQHKVNSALNTTGSGMEIIRYWLSNVTIPGGTAQSSVFELIADSVKDIAGVSNITTTYSAPASTITIPTVTLDSAAGKTFSAVINQVDPNTLQIDITGQSGAIARTMRVNYDFTTRAQSVFDFGVASKGPLSLSGDAGFNGVNVAVEASVYIESADILALSVTGKSKIAGDVSIVNPLATVNLQGGLAEIGEETGQEAIDNHVTFGVPPTEFPTPDPGYFESYAVNIIDASTNTSADATFENVRIKAGTNPNFTGHVTLKGIVFIETPNIVTFTGGTEITGIIVGDGDVTDNSGTNEINFNGTVDSYPVSQLPDEPQFADIRDDTGTFAMAPGFSLTFGGNFTALNGAIAGNGIEFSGDAGGTINGSILNYSNEELLLSGNSALSFNRSGASEIPAGFVPEIILEYNPASYLEVAL